ncbi:cytochrome b/b6 domain-containing protein [Henriciella litoralis]|uniref:cytochrome b/b6 domain-containing protein n=1 Tax=Henriciella litoralis TaxID=568102 RepID=UPI000A027357|nr:cytochrome b/b6 domain-containing protein [Henriciella litoralis]
MTQSSRYSAVAIALHWVIALAIGFMIWLGWNMDGNEARYQLHKSVGITILLLTVARIVWRLINRPPPLPAGMPAYERAASHFVHIAFYTLLIVMPLSGWLLVSTSYDFDVPTVLYGQVSWPDLPGVGPLSNETGHGIIEFVHSKLAWVMIGLVALHVAGAIKHEVSSEEGVLKRMLPGLFGKADAPSPPPSGFFIAFGAAIALFLLIAFVPPLFSGSSQASSSAQDSPAQSSGIEPNWNVDYDASSIQFSGTHENARFEGGFSDWTADIQFDKDALDTSAVKVTVRTASASTGKKLYTDSLKSGEWLNPSDYPEAVVSLTDFKATANGYTAEATLTLKENSVSFPFNFTLTEEGDQTRMTGEAQLERKPLDLGQKSDPGADWVSETIDINVDVLASPRT